MKKLLSFILMFSILTGFTACVEKTEKTQKTEIQVFIAASLQKVMTELAEQYQKEHPEVGIVFQADSSGTLLTQIEEGYECDIFFSAAEKQMNMLEEDGLVINGTRADVVNNELVLVTRKGSGTKVTGLDNLKDAKSIALAGGSVPAGKYTRQALANKKILEKAEDVSKITTSQVSNALDGVEISEQDNVSKVLIAVLEGSCEVGTMYYSDIYGHENELEVIETVSTELTGDVRYPICLVDNKEAEKEQMESAKDFWKYILSDEAEKTFEKYYFDTNIE